MKPIKTLRDVLASGMSARNISGELAHRTGLPENMVEQIIAENNWERDEILRDIAEARPHRWIVSNETRGWVIVDIYTGNMKLIGMSTGRTKNYYDAAIKEAARRNRKYSIHENKPGTLTAMPITKADIIRKIEGMRTPMVNAKYLQKLKRMRA
ncbi:MAG: hypothetical protein PHW62_00745 [Candidatus Ratteibacteria bacterium]|nr:hypothetical protein [Candidatus Ratteibacteria bacterium]